MHPEEVETNGKALKVFCVTTAIGFVVILFLIAIGVIPLYPIGPIPPP